MIYNFIAISHTSAYQISDMTEKSQGILDGGDVLFTGALIAVIVSY